MADFIADGATSQNAVHLVTSGGDLISIFPTSYNAKDSCKLLGSPSEGGLMQYDNKVTQPRKIQFTGIIKSPNYAIVDTLRRIAESEDLEESICTFYGKAGTLENMILESVEEIGDKNRFDAVEVKISLHEYLEHNSM